jgi:transcription antitermination factor NusG
MRNILAVLCLISASYAQTPTRVIGEVESKGTDQITVKTDAGQSVNMPVSAETKVVRVPPGETSLAKATTITFADVNPGDRVLVRTNQIIVMSTSDLQQKQEAERAEWQKRGSAGRITAIGDQQLTITTPAGQSLKITTTPTTTFRRYAPESVRFSDAKPSSFSDLKVGDQVRVLGDKTGDTVAAEAIVSGVFRNFAATVVSVDANAGEIKVTDLQTKKPVIVKVNSESLTRKMPPMMAQMMAARRQAGGAEHTPAANPNPSPAGAAPERGQGTPGMRGGGGPRDIGRMLERMPALNVADLKPGDALIIASTAGSDPSRTTAIAVLAGVEPLLTGPAADGRLNGPWNFDINIVP